MGFISGRLNPLGQEIIKIRLEDGVVLASIPTEPSPYGSLIFDGAHLWFYHQYSEEFFLGGNLQKIPIRTIPTDQGPGKLVEDGNYIWVANYDSHTVTKIRADTGVPLPPFKIGQSPLDLLLIRDKLWVTGPDTLFKLNHADGKLLATFPLSRPDPTNLVYDGVNLWAGHKAAISRYRESDGAPAGIKDYPSLPLSEIYLSYDGANVWALQSPEGNFQKLKADFSPLLTYSSNYKQAPIQVGRYFWGIDPLASATGSTLYFELYRVDPSNGSQLTISLPTPYEGLGLAYGNNYIWVTSWQVPLSNPSASNAVKITGVCKGQYPLFHQATQTVWVACPEDNTIQAIYSLATPEAKVTLSPAAPAPGGEQLYLPLVVKREGE